jgi:undecaprenyl-diphosphatase
MIDWLEEIDRQIVLFVNGLHTPNIDQVMWLISSKLIWIPFYILLLLFVYVRKGLIPTLLFLSCALLLVFISDFLSVHAFKEVFQRYRPSHNLLISEKLHFYKLPNGQEYKGGQFGFISSHASNFAAITTFFLLYLREVNRKWIFVIPMILVGLSRIYLGVHYLSDVVVGFLFGGVLAFGIYKFVFFKLIRNLTSQ